MTLRLDEPIDFFDPQVIYITVMAQRRIEEALDVTQIDDALRTAVELPHAHGVLLAVRRIPERFKDEYKAKHGIETTTR